MICSSDGRTVLREQRHAAILDAARALAVEHGPTGFTIDRVATLAGVSRRTVFNHFTGIDQLLVTVCEEILAEVTTDLLADVDRRIARLPEDRGSDVVALDAVLEATRGIDLPTAIVSIHLALGGPQGADERSDAISRTAFEHVIGLLRERLLDRAPDLDPLDLELTLTLLISGITHLAKLWLASRPDLDVRHGDSGSEPAQRMTSDARIVPPDARDEWDRLLDHLLHRLRLGYGRVGGSNAPTPAHERPATRHG